MLQQLIDLSFGCDDLRQPSAAKIIGSKQAPAAVPASDVAAAYAAAVIRPMGAVDGWQLYVQERPMLWSVPLYRLLRPTVAAVLSEEGGGSLALPAVRGLIKAQTEAQRSVEEEWVRRTPPLEHAAFAPRGAPPPAPPLTRGYCDEVLGCLLSLQRIQAGDGQRRSRVAGLTHLAAVVRKPAARPLLARVRLPVHAAPLLSDTEPEVREAAFAVFLALSELAPAPRRAEDTAALAGLPADAAEPERLLYACFGEHALMHALARYASGRVSDTGRLTRAQPHTSHRSAPPSTGRCTTAPRLSAAASSQFR